MRKPLRAAALALALLFLQTSLSGCFGRFALVRKVYGFNESIGDKWLRSILLFAMIVIPVYQVAGLVDWVLLNTIEFWSGNNPVTLEEGRTLEKTAVAADGTVLKMIIADRGESARLEVSRPGERARVLELHRGAAGAELREGGALLASVAITAEGGAEVRGAGGELLSARSPLEISQLSGSLRLGAEPLLSALEVQAASRLASAAAAH